MSNTYKEIKRLTGNNKGYAAMAHAAMIEDMDWLDGQTFDTIYLRNADNDWVAIPDYYTDEISDDIQSNPMFTTMTGKVVCLGADDNANYIAVVSE